MDSEVVAMEDTDSTVDSEVATEDSTVDTDTDTIKPN